MRKYASASRWSPGALGLFAAVGSIEDFLERSADGLPIATLVLGGVLCLAGLAAFVAHWMHWRTRVKHSKR